MQIALLLAAKLSKTRTVGTHLDKGEWELVGGAGNGKGSQLVERNKSFSQFSPTLGSIIKIEKGEYVEVEVVPDSRDSELYLYLQRISQDEL